ncbi:hypothetical protein J2S74_002981 [Evansella vedderi]|uniref:Uncharacterized protein n=1 Tax=Evansella vedderi TaxID=38282 RepID=A0ABT9ZWK1_9BACI|nr:hypothetical protein [Evansella vedderi]MDQ0255599.1 hypothetical protein [Evansella vedderi]
MKKWILGFLAVYLVIGMFWFFGNNDEDVVSTESIDVSIFEENFTEQSIRSFDLSDESSKQNNITYWLRNPNLKPYVRDYHERGGGETDDPETQIMTFFAMAQYEEVELLSSYIRPDKSHLDFQGINVLEMSDKAAEYAKSITRNHTINSVYLSEPMYANEEEVSYHVTIIFEDETQVTLNNVTLVRMSDTESWHLDSTLTQIVERIERKVKN